MQILMVTDIFGKTDDTRSQQIAFSKMGIISTIIDPFSGVKQNFQSETEAYQKFMDVCGHEQYTILVENALKEITTEIVLIGFSAGASAVWNALSKLSTAKIKYVFCFYPPQIRHHLENIPSTPMTLFFPPYEKHFDIEEMLKRLSTFKNILCVKTKYLHGFMNPFSENYSQEAAKAYTQKIRSFLVL